RIANGALQGAPFGSGEAGQRIPCEWDYSGDGDAEIWTEDDYGISLRNSPAMKRVGASEMGGSWEID
ncbi:MAG: hypothetical protein LQ347_005692, partial [Umbilicaria vellea]